MKSCSTVTSGKFSLGAGLALSFLLPLVFAQDLPKGLKPWQTSWAAFVQTYNRCLKSAGCERNQFIDKEVYWEGTVKSIELDKLGVSLEMGSPTIEDKVGTKPDILAFYLKPKADELESWKPVKRGDQVRFSTKMAGGITGSVVSFAPAMQIRGREIKMALLNCEGGKLLMILPESKDR